MGQQRVLDTIVCIVYTTPMNTSLNPLNLPTSSWLHDVRYVRRARNVDLGAADGLLLTTLNNGEQYVAAVPSWLVGLFVARARRLGSTGRAWVQMVKGKWPSVRVNKEA